MYMQPSLLVITEFTRLKNIQGFILKNRLNRRRSKSKPKPTRDRNFINRPPMRK